MTVNLWGCGGQSVPAEIPPEAIVVKSKPEPTKVLGKISEVSPPEVIQQLRSQLDKYQPQVSIVSPRPDEVLKDNTVSVKLQVKDLPIFKDERLGLGPHLHVFLDDQPYQAVYDTSQPLVLKDLQAGTHTLRVFAGRPWHESFKNDGAYAQATFHVFTKTPNASPNPDQPLLTYSRPQGNYGAEPIMLDFFLTNAPLHFVAQEDSQDEVADWRIRVTVNGSSFVIDRWQPIYLRGFDPGKNWIQLEYIDENGNIIQNVYNNTARIFTYEPGGKDTLSKLVRGELSFEQARSMVDRSYKYEEPPQPVETPAPVPTPEASPAPVEEVPEVEPAPVPEKTEAAPTPAEAPSQPKGGFFNRFRRGEAPEPAPSIVPAPVIIPEPEETPVAPEPEVKEAPEVVTPSESPASGFFNRFRRGESTPEPAPQVEETPEVEETPAPEATETPEVVVPPVVVPVTPESPVGGFFNRFRRSEQPAPSPAVTTPEEETAEPEEPKSEEPKENVFDRFRRAIPKPSPSAAPAEEPKVETPAAVETPEATEPQESPFDRFRRSIPKLAPSPIPVEEPKVEVPAAIESPEPVEAPAEPKENPFDRFRRAIPKPSPTVAPAPVEEPQEAAPIPTETQEPETVAPAATKENPLERFRRFLPKPSPSATPAPVEEPVPAPVEETPEAVETPEPEVSAPTEVKEPETVTPAQPKENPLERFRRSLPKPTPKPVEVPPEPGATESPEPSPVSETATPTAQENPLDRFRQFLPKPAPSVAPAPTVEEPAPSITPSPAPAPNQESAPDGRSELEKRLGVPIKPAVPQPVAPKPKPTPYSTQFQRPTAIPTPESNPVELPDTLETPDSEPVPIQTIP